METILEWIASALLGHCDPHTQAIILPILAGLLMVSEGLSLIPKFRSNGVVQLVVNLLKAVTSKSRGVGK